MEGFEWLGSSVTQANAEKYLKLFWHNVSLDGTTPLATSRGSLIGAYMDTTGGFPHFLTTRKLQDPTSGSDTCILGYYVKTGSTFFGGDMITFVSGGTDLVMIEVDGSGGLTLLRGGTGATLATSPYSLSTNTEYYLEFKVVFNSTTGSIQMKVADITAAGDDDAETATEWTSTGLNTIASDVAAGEDTWDSLQIRHVWNAGHAIYDDIYICNGAGSDDFRGNLYVETIEPTGAGNSTQLTPSAGSNWENVDDSTNPDDDTTYNTADADGETDLYTCSNPTESADPEAVQVQALVRCTDADRRTIRLPIRNSSTTSEGSDSVILSDEYRGRSRITETDATGAAWTNANVNGLEIGIKRQANS